MQSFTIRDIENLTGIKAHTLRIWEQRFSFFSPKRKQSLHRFYDNEDLKILLRISFLYHRGWKISKIASLSPEQVMDEVRNADIKEHEYIQYVSRLIESAIDFDEAGFTTLLNEITARIGFEKCITDVCYPYLKKLGLLWSTNHVIPAQEHFSSYIIQNRIIVETEKLETTSQKPEIILICPQGEFHELPLLFINYLMRKSDWSTVYLGVNIKKNELKELAGIPSIKYIYLHLITNFTGMYVDDYLEDIRKDFPDKQILVSGAGIAAVQRKFVNVTILENDRVIRDFIKVRSGVRDS